MSQEKIFTQQFAELFLVLGSRSSLEQYPPVIQYPATNTFKGSVMQSYSKVKPRTRPKSVG